MSTALTIAARVITKGHLVVAQLLEQSLPIPEVRSSNPVITNIYINHLFTVNCIEKQKKEKEAGNGPFLKKSHQE